MNEQWIVLQVSGDQVENWCCYGPFRDEVEARNFAAFVTDEIDPAAAFKLGSPVAELLNWRQSAGAR